MNEVNTMQSII